MIYLWTPIDLFKKEQWQLMSNTTEAGTWLEKKDQTYLSEYIGRLTGPEGDLTAQDVTGTPKYYAMFGGATGLSDTTSGSIYLAPTPDVNYEFRIFGFILSMVCKKSLSVDIKFL